jgi:hypothetical protein
VISSITLENLSNKGSAHGLCVDPLATELNALAWDPECETGYPSAILPSDGPLRQ